MAPLSNLSLLILATCSVLVQAIPTISAVGSKFFTSEGSQFYIKGVAYQLVEDDPLVDTAQCTRDAALMQQLGANSIRVYHVDGTADHSGCMNAFASVGIYLWVDLDSFKTYIRYGTEANWTTTKSDSYRAVMDNFQQYDNTAGFFVGNEVLNTIVDAGSAPYLLSAATDLKAYSKAKGYRQIPIGYSATDTAVLRPMLQDYVVCRPNTTERLDFYALNSYEWCGSTTYAESGYSQLQATAEGYPVPIFFSEDGCNTVPPRDFSDQSAIFSSPMSDTWSGAIIYEWIQETNNYGLISYGPAQGTDVQVGSSVVQGFTRQGTPTPVQPDFSYLQAQWATLKPTGVGSSSYAANHVTSTRSCPAFTATGWTVNPNAALPTLGQDALSGMTTGLPSTIPSGTITVTSHGVSRSVSSGSPSSPISSVSSSFLTGSGTATTTSSSSKGSAASSATSAGVAGKQAINPVMIDMRDSTVSRMMIGLATVCAGAMIWL